MNNNESIKGAVAGRYASLLLDYLRTCGLDPSRLYLPQRVAQIESISDPLRLPVVEYIAMLEAAQAALDDPDLGFKAGVSMQPRHLGIVGYILMSCTTFGEVLEQYGRYVRLTHTFGRLLVVHRGSMVEMPLDWSGKSAPPPALAQLIMSSRAKIGRLLTGHDEAPFDVSFQFARPRNAALYENFFRGRVRFGQSRTCLMCPASYQQFPVGVADADVSEAIRGRADALLKELSSEPKFLRDLKLALNHGMVVGRVTAADAANALGMSVRSLHRRLAEHDCVFRNTLDGLRRERAEQLLHQTQSSLAEVAFMLGYTEQSTFQHAFKRWTGLTPGDYRLRKTQP